ncbi:hypothetical protein E2562_011413 [Oryza meyeriana var. granulata]|uniref:Uncharacterized protein n=1 Tax=Oryza meyeriana var. granulata TaxID=110450 RepID=A0A6G1D0L7_9ORYZ|nr:hypothetical protein E2562_011413 [Oryza meyeriana var. granulata]
MSEHPFLLRNLAEILDDTEGSQENKRLAAEILRNLATDGKTRQEIGCIRVLERITDSTVATELEVLIGLSSQICHIVPEDFAQELEHDQIKERFVKKLVEALNANTKPTAHCPRIRREVC